METALLGTYGVREPKDLKWDWGTKPDPWEIPEVTRFLEGALACGFVCADFKVEEWTDLESVHMRPEEMIGQMGAPELRKYVHTVQRAEKWADGYGSPLLRALSSGSLQIVARRLESDDSLYEPW